MYAPSNNTPKKKERRVAVVFRRTNEPVHCGGVESLLLLPEQGSLLTASRDSTIRRWDMQQPSAPGVNPPCQASYEAHTDWVNDLAVYQNILFSCSNDRTVRVWQTQSTGTLLSSMCHHSDYVTCLTAAQQAPLLATGGLRGEVFLIDIAAGATHRLRPKQQPVSQQQAAQQQGPAGQRQYNPQAGAADANGNGMPAGTASSTNSQAGIYSLALNAPGTTLAAGSSDQVIRLWDIRSGEKVAKLRGHTDNVRCVLLKEDDSLLLSGGADGTIRLWDLGMQRCINTYVVHTDSVRCLDVTPDWSVVYSGGRDKCVFRTRLSTRSAELLVQEPAAITSLAIDHTSGSMWVATPRSTVHQWALPKESSQPHSSAHAGSRMRASSGMSGALRKSVETLAPAPSVSAPCATISGLPAIIMHKVLSDRRQVLTKDEQGQVALWDVLAGREVARYGQVDMDAQERALFEARHCPAWFTADNRLGTLSISLEPPHCFNAEDYAQALGYTQAPDDLKVNYGKLVLECVFAKWKYKVLLSQQGAAGGGLSPGSPPGAPAPGQAQQQQQQQLQQQQQQMYGQLGQQQPDQGVYYPEAWPQYWQGVPPVVMCTSASGLPWRRVITQLTGAEAEPEDIPTWVGDVVLRNAVVTPREAKCSFVLLPAEGSNLPSLLQSRLTAPRILQVHKVANYCVGRLAETQLQLVVHPVFLTAQPEGSELQGPGEEARPPGTEMELICNNLAVPFEMSLSAVKKFIWGKPDDIVFQYRIRDPANPAPLPVILPPKQ